MHFPKGVVFVTVCVMLFPCLLVHAAQDDTVRMQIDCGRVEIPEISKYLFGVTSGPFYDKKGLDLNKQAGFRLIEVLLQYRENPVPHGGRAGGEVRPANSFGDVASMVEESLRLGMDVMLSFVANKAPADRQAYQAEVRQQVRDLRKLAGNQGKDIKLLRFGNEPEYAVFWQGTPLEFFQTFELWVSAVREVAPNALIVAPGFASPPINVRNRDMKPLIGAFLDYCKSRSLPLDVLAIHGYGIDPYYSYGLPIAVMREQLRQYSGLSPAFGTPLVANNEWNLPTPYPQKYETSFDTAWAAAHNVASFIQLIVNGAYIGVRYGGSTINTTLREFREPDFILVDHNHSMKPSYHAMDGINAFADYPVVVSTNGQERNMSVLAGLNEKNSELYIAVCNYPFVRFKLYGGNPEQGEPPLYPVAYTGEASRYSLQIKGLPFSGSEKVQLNRYRVDDKNMGSLVEERLLDGRDAVELSNDLPGPAIDFIRLRKVR